MYSYANTHTNTQEYVVWKHTHTDICIRCTKRCKSVLHWVIVRYNMKVSDALFLVTNMQRPPPIYPSLTNHKLSFSGLL